MNLNIAEEIVTAAVKKADEIGSPSVIAVVDSGGHLQILKRMDGAIFGSVGIAMDKAYTSAATQVSTQELGESSQPGKPLYGLNTTNQCRYIVFGGGIPLWYRDKLVGAIGVSGGTVEQDVAVAQRGVEVFERISKSGGKIG